MLKKLAVPFFVLSLAAFNGVACSDNGGTKVDAGTGGRGTGGSATGGSGGSGTGGSGGSATGGTGGSATDAGGDRPDGATTETGGGDSSTTEGGGGETAAIPTCTTTTAPTDTTTPMTATTFCQIFLPTCGTALAGHGTQAACEASYMAAPDTVAARKCRSYHVCNARSFAMMTPSMPTPQMTHCTHAAALSTQTVCM
jgi:hypothetical protein